MIRLTETYGESRDGRGGGDHDAAYSPGHPRDYLTWREQARLTVLRGRILDASHSEPGTLYAGDQSYTVTSPCGLALIDGFINEETDNA